METAITILGARGSVPVSGSAFSRYGGATICVLARFGADYIVLDAGTGLMALPEDALAQPALPLLLTHAHADHLVGLPLCPYAMKKDARRAGRPRAGLPSGFAAAVARGAGGAPRRHPLP